MLVYEPPVWWFSNISSWVLRINSLGRKMKKAKIIFVLSLEMWWIYCCHLSGKSPAMIRPILLTKQLQSLSDELFEPVLTFRMRTWYVVKYPLKCVEISTEVCWNIHWSVLKYTLKCVEISTEVCWNIHNQWWSNHALTFYKNRLWIMNLSIIPNQSFLVSEYSGCWEEDI